MTLLGKTVYHGSRLALAAVFIYSGAVKANEIATFAGEIANYKIFPYAWNYLIAAILPYLELLCGILLLLNLRVRPAVFILFLLNIVFIVALLSAIIRGLDIDCGCFDPDSATPTSLIVALWRDFGLLFLMVFTWVLRYAQQPEESE
ncbi:MAG: MauE/DoxX family redox-associated membrane protein [Thermodesulfobacteriota bacterium]|nr:MauE/DoxX family redox-associated membrane protein [Thermodesulfobacteriota bacterium]